MDVPGRARLMEVAEVRARCTALHDRVLLDPLLSGKLSPAAKQSLLRLIAAELRFLSRRSPDGAPVSSNTVHLAAVTLSLLHPSLSHVSRACGSFPAHVDAVCTLHSSPVWLVVSARNPRHVPWLGGIQARVKSLLEAAEKSPLALRPDSMILVFARGATEDVVSGLAREFGALEMEFFHELGEEGDSCAFVRSEMDFINWMAFEIRVGCSSREVIAMPTTERLDARDDVGFGCGGGEFGSLVSAMRAGADGCGTINFDTTALIAMVSGISNGDGERLLSAPEDKMRARFKGNYDFVIDQVRSELKLPILAELVVVVAGKKSIACQSVHSEFNELVSICGGPNEKFRASQLMKYVLIVQDNPSSRVNDLRTTRKINLKNKVVFGTGDFWHAPTLTANIGYVRAVLQTGMSLLTIEHRPRALTGD